MCNFSNWCPTLLQCVAVSGEDAGFVNVSAHVHANICLYLCGRPPLLWVGFAAGSCLGSLSQSKPAKGMEFPLTIKQVSAWEAKQTEGRGLKGGCFNSELLGQPQSQAALKGSSAFTLNYRPSQGHGPEGWAESMELLTGPSVRTPESLQPGLSP